MLVSSIQHNDLRKVFLKKESCNHLKGQMHLKYFRVWWRIHFLMPGMLGTKIPHTEEQLSPGATPGEACVPQQRPAQPKKKKGRDSQFPLKKIQNLKLREESDFSKVTQSVRGQIGIFNCLARTLLKIL